MKDCKFNIGDCVQIKSLEQFRNEYGERANGIPVPFCGFNRAMYHLCGAEFHIKEIHYDRDEFYYFRSEEGVENSRPYAEFWFITEDMLIASDALPESKAEIDEDEFMSLLQ